MAQRRSLVAGVNAPENTDLNAVRAFVTQERAPEPIEEPATDRNVVKPANDANEPRVSAPEEKRTPHRPSVRRQRHQRRLPVGLIPVTVRLPPEIAGALKRASLERQLSGEEIYTQQDIVEIALEPWLRAEGHLS